MVEISRQEFLFLSSCLCESLLLLTFISNNFDFICNNNNKQVYFVTMLPTMSSEYFFVGNNINKFVKVTTTDTQLLKLKHLSL